MIRITLADKERFLARRKAELGIKGQHYVAVNAGRRRSGSKCSLLRAIEQEARSSGRVPPFRGTTG